MKRVCALAMSSLLMFGSCLLLGAPTPTTQVVTIQYQNGAVIVTPKIVKADVGDKIVWVLNNQGTLVLSFPLPFETVNVRGSGSPSTYTFIMKNAGTYFVGCSAIINGELEGWLAGDTKSGTQVEPGGTKGGG